MQKASDRHSEAIRLAQEAQQRILQDECISALFNMHAIFLHFFLQEHPELVDVSFLTRQTDGERVDALCLLLLGALFKKTRKLDMRIFKTMLTVLCEYKERIPINKKLLKELIQGHQDLREVLLQNNFAFALDDKVQEKMGVISAINGAKRSPVQRLGAPLESFQTSESNDLIARSKTPRSFLVEQSPGSNPAPKC